MAALTGLLFGIAMRPDYDEALTRSTPRLELHGPVFQSGGNSLSGEGLAVIVTQPFSSMQRYWRSLTPTPRPARPAPQLVALAGEPQDVAFDERADPPAAPAANEDVESSGVVEEAPETAVVVPPPPVQESPDEAPANDEPT